MSASQVRTFRRFLIFGGGGWGGGWGGDKIKMVANFSLAVNRRKSLAR